MRRQPREAPAKIGDPVMHRQSRSPMKVVDVLRTPDQPGGWAILVQAGLQDNPDAVRLRLNLEAFQKHFIPVG